MNDETLQLMSRNKTNFIKSIICALGLATTWQTQQQQKPQQQQQQQQQKSQQQQQQRS